MYTLRLILLLKYIMYIARKKNDLFYYFLKFFLCKFRSFGEHENVILSSEYISLYAMFYNI